MEESVSLDEDEIIFFIKTKAKRIHQQLNCSKRIVKGNSSGKNENYTRWKLGSKQRNEVSEMVSMCSNIIFLTFKFL